MYFGIIGAVVLRMVFYLVGSEFFRMAWVMQLLFGLVLLWSASAPARISWVGS